MEKASISYCVVHVGDTQRVTWVNPARPDDCGEFEILRDADAITWVLDGRDRIAALPERMLRFYRRGIASRCRGLVSRYLRGVVPLPQNTTVVNFGANIGEVAMVLAGYGNQILAIEPDPNILPLLAANAAGRNIEVIPVAAWNLDCQVRLYLKSDSADTSVFNASDEYVFAPAKPIDSIVSERGIDRVGLIIGDAEGAEPEVLEGARETLRITDYVSVCASAERCGERTSEACAEILKSAGFDIIHRDETGFCTLIGRNANLMKQVA